MAARNGRTAEQVKSEIASERDELASAVETLRAEIGEAANVGAKLQSKLPLAAAGAAGAGFVLAGGIGATARLLMRRGREGREKARIGPFSLVDRG